LRIAICEDVAEQALQIAEFVLQHPSTKTYDIYYSADDLLNAYSEGNRYDLIFLDIQMDGQNGFQAAEIINSQYQDEKPLIAFVTSATSYAPQGYEVAWRYLVKPVNSDTIHRCIYQAESELNKNVIFVKTKNGNIGIGIKSIIYIDVNYGTVTIHSTGDVFITNMTLKTVSDMLPKGIFVQVHRCYYVNLAHVTGYEGKYIKMSNGDTVSFGKNNKNDFIQALSLYLGRR
jgi:DNA-binding LytR/AlgR family response regulator